MFFDLYFIIILSIHLRCSKRLSDISEEMKQRNVDGKVLLVALKPETKVIVLCLDTVVPTGPTSGSKIVEDSANKSYPSLLEDNDPRLSRVNGCSFTSKGFTQKCGVLLQQEWNLTEVSSSKVVGVFYRNTSHDRNLCL